MENVSTGCVKNCMFLDLGPIIRPLLFLNFVGLFRDLLTGGCIFFSMVMHMGLLIVNLYGISLRKFMNLRKPCGRWLFLLFFLVILLWHSSFSSLVNSRSLQCAESALHDVLGDLSHTYFVGNAPMGHVVIQPKEDAREISPFKVWFFKTSACSATEQYYIYQSKHASFLLLMWLFASYFLRILCLLNFIFCPFQRFFFKSQVIATNKFNISKCKDFVWVTKDELLEYFPEQAEYLNKMIIS